MRRQILIYFFLLASLLVQAEAVFACASMDGKVQSQCCCPDMEAPGCGAHHACEAARESASGGCCDLQPVRCWVAADIAVGLNHTLVPDPLWLAAPPPASALIVQPSADRPPSRHQTLDSDWLTGTDTYLTTRRLRD